MSTQGYRVMKFGGSSVGSSERLLRVIEIISHERDKGPVAITVSAMGDSTDWLIDAVETAAKGDHEAAEAIIDQVADVATTNALVCLQHIEQEHGKLAGERPQFTPMVREMLSPLRQFLYGISLVREASPQSIDLTMSFGERLSASILATLLTAKGCPAVFVDARTWTVTDDTFSRAIVDWNASKARVDELREGWGDAIPVNTGFLGRTPDGRTTTLGRNGSDYTATLLARALGADEVNVWTDVSGVMTADPGIVDDAISLRRLSYWEALELANFGARMFHPRTMIPLIESGIPMRIRNTMAPDDPGTLVADVYEPTERTPTSVTSLENLALLDVEWRRLSQQAKVGERVLRALDLVGVPVWMANQAAHGQAVAVIVPHAQIEVATAAIEEELALEIERHECERVGVSTPVTLLTLVAETLAYTPNVAGRFFGALGAVGVNIRAIAQGASSRSISCVIESHDTEVAVRTVHAAFNFAHQDVNVLVLGKGVVGGELLKQIREHREDLEAEHDVRINVVGIADSKRALFDAVGLDLDGWEERLESSDASTEDDHIVGMLDELRRLSVPVLVDCTAADGMEDHYARAFARGIHVVAANKKPLTIPTDVRNELMAEARAFHRAYHYETTVGASLPVIDTLKNLVRTGDHVYRIEGSFSGTLGYLTNELMAGVSLSDAVRTAKELGYTEPHPRDDLSGLDVARKALILARELGLELNIEDVVVEPLVPAELLDHDDVDEFFRALARYDATMADTIEGMKSENKTLRYLAVIDPSAAGEDRPALEVKPIAIPADHPATRLRGSESFVAFKTERYEQYPLIVQGAGAGGAVTAAGVLADVLKVSQTLRGR